MKITMHESITAFILAGLLVAAYAPKAHSKEATASFTACSPKGNCSYHELVAPTMSACQLGLGVVDWLNRNKPDYTLKNGWKCDTHSPGEDIPV
jgi:hypothetical protein